MDVVVRADSRRFDVLRCVPGEVPDEAIAAWRGDDLTLVVPAGFDYPHVQRQPGWALIHLEADLPFDVVGFLARYANAWAAAGIPILAYASYRFDHVFVPADRLEEALAIARTAWN